MTGFAILLGFNLLGIVLKKYLSLPLPGNVIGLILFTISLSCHWIKLEWVEETSSFLLRHLVLFFVPIIVGTIALRSLLATEWVAVVSGIVLSTLLTIAITGWTTAWFIHKEEESSNG